MSLASTWPLMTVSSLPEADPSVATGASFTGVTVRLTLATLLSSKPSLALKLKLSEPLKFADGV